MEQKTGKPGLVHQWDGDLVRKNQVIGNLITGYCSQCRAEISHIHRVSVKLLQTSEFHQVV